LNCVISVVAAVEDDVAVEVAIIGYDGTAGLPAFLGTAASPHRSFCQVPGLALRLETVTLRRFLAGDGALHDLLHRYTHAVLAFLAQNIACNRLHSAEERTARWLAQTHDRVGSDSIQITQEFLAQMLGVRRATVSVSARILQRAGLIRYNRGCVTILDRAGLRRAACDCYLTIRREFDKLR
jgi:CRP-like cAMP-binding protein